MNGKKKQKEKKKEITKSYFTLDSVKHSLHVFYFGMRFYFGNAMVTGV